MVFAVPGLAHWGEENTGELAEGWGVQRANCQQVIVEEDPEYAVDL